MKAGRCLLRDEENKRQNKTIVMYTMQSEVGKNCSYAARDESKSMDMYV